MRQTNNHAARHSGVINMFFFFVSYLQHLAGFSSSGIDHRGHLNGVQISGSFG